MPRKGMRTMFFQPSQSSPSMSSPPPPPNPTLSYSLIEENIATAESLITKWDYSNANSKIITPLFGGDTRLEAKRYLNAVKGLQSAMQYLVRHHSTSNILVRAQLLMQLAMKTLQKEFYQILSSNREHLDPESVSNHSSMDRRSNSFSDYDEEISDDEFRVAGNTISETERVSMLAMADLKAIAECMISSGYGKECVKVYIVMRKSIVDEALYHLGVERLSFNQVQKMDWEVIELKIKTWLNAVKIAVRTLFHGERILCDEVFAASEKRIAESCFAEITKEGAISLFTFPEMVGKCKKTPEKMFRTLDLYEAINDHWQQIQFIFSYESTDNVRLQAVKSLVKLAEAVKTMLTEFESAIQKDSSKKPISGGGIHPLTRYCMNYITFLADYSGVLADIVFDLPQSPLPESYYQTPTRSENPSSSSEISEKIAWLILVLLCKLDGKTEQYKDASLSYLFLANNMQYIIVKVRKSNLGFLLGEDWLRNHEAKVREYVSKFVRVGWNKVLSALPENSTAEMTAGEVRERFVKFNAAFDEECRKQSSWIVSDPKLRDEIKGSIGSKLVRKYGLFYEKCRTGSESVIKYKPEFIESYLCNILYGVVGDAGSISSISSSTTSSSSRGSNLR